MNLSRRNFIKTAAGVAGYTLFPHTTLAQSHNHIDQVVLGNTGIQLSRLALGTGTHGWKYVSDQTKLGTKGFVKLAHEAYDRGINFLDVADIYGSHKFAREALKTLPRDKMVVMSKIWTTPNDWMKKRNYHTVIDEFRKELGVETIDLLLIHCMTTPDWDDSHAELMEIMSRAKEEGIIRAHGLSCHSLDALKRASELDWVDFVLARINNGGARMDGKPEEVMPVLKKIHDSGKGVLGMKIFRCGDLVETEQRQSSLEYVLNSGNVDAMTIGVVNSGQITDTITRIKGIIKA